MPAARERAQRTAIAVGDYLEELEQPDAPNKVLLVSIAERLGVHRKTVSRWLAQEKGLTRASSSDSRVWITCSSLKKHLRRIKGGA